jgi:hypothetical protein
MVIGEPATFAIALLPVYTDVARMKEWDIGRPTSSRRSHWAARRRILGGAHA